MIRLNRRIIKYSKMMNSNVYKDVLSVLKGKDKEIQLLIANKTLHTEDSYKFKAVFENKKNKLGNKPGQCIKIYSKDVNGNNIGKYFTPISDSNTEGYCEFIIKVYNKKSENSKEGYFSSSLEQYEIGDYISISGPYGNIIYKGNDSFEFLNENITRKFECITFIAGGGAIIPFYQMITAIVNDQSSKCKINVFCASRKEKTIILKNELNSLNLSDRMSLDFILSQDDDKGKYSKGYIDKQYISKNFEPPKKEHFILFYGPPNMTKSIEANLLELEYEKENFCLFNSKYMDQ